MIAGWVGLWLGPAPALGHPGAEERLSAGVTIGCDPAGWLSVARGHAEDGRTSEALDALSTASDCGLERPVVLDARARILAEALASDRRVPAASVLAAVDEAIAANGAHARLRMDRSRALAALGRAAEAAAEARAALASEAAAIRPDDALEIAALLCEVGDREGALAVLDDALARGGPSPALVDAASRIELSLGRPLAALDRLEGLPETAWWLDRRGVAAVYAGEIDRAIEAWERARALAMQRPSAANRALAAELGRVLDGWTASGSRRE